MLMAKLPGMSGRASGNKYPGMTDREQRERFSSPLPKSKAEVLERAGFGNRGYLDKKGTKSGLDATFNHLPPGMEIGDQRVADINKQKFYRYEGFAEGYTGDGFHAGYREEDEV
jgi:hypothetical protein